MRPKRACTSEKSWKRDHEYVITYYGKPLRTREFYDRWPRLRA
jgi:hypothetical protein